MVKTDTDKYEALKAQATRTVKEQAYVDAYDVAKNAETGTQDEKVAANKALNEAKDALTVA